MAPLIINVTGTSTISRQPERAVIYVNVSNAGSVQSDVTQSVTRTAKQLQTDLNQLAPKDSNGKAAANAPITHWSMQSISTGSYFMYVQKGGNTEKEVRYTASTSFTIRFADFEKLGNACTNLANLPFASISRVGWELTEKTKTAGTSEVRRLAVEDAVSKAKDLARAVGKHNVVPVEISSDAPVSQMRPAVATTMFGSSAMAPPSIASKSGEALNFEPEDINMDCHIHMKLEAW
jgi:uncharacterized protein